MNPHIDWIYEADDEGQEYPIGVRVDALATDEREIILQPDPLGGAHRIVRCERFERSGKKQIRVSLQLVR
jgi:hypothetical protein